MVRLVSVLVAVALKLAACTNGTARGLITHGWSRVPAGTPAYQAGFISNAGACAGDCHSYFQPDTSAQGQTCCTSPGQQASTGVPSINVVNPRVPDTVGYALRL